MTKNYKPLKELCKEAGLKPIPFIPVSRELEAKIKKVSDAELMAEKISQAKINTQIKENTLVFVVEFNLQN